MKQKIKFFFDKFWELSDDFDFKILHEQECKPFKSQTPNFLEKEVNDSYNYDNNKWVHTEYIKNLKKNIIIEPDYLYCITDFNKIISTSAFYPNLKPSLPRYFLSLLRKKQIKIPQAILFDGQVGLNYFHFFSDVLSKIWLIKKIENYKNIPLIIGEMLYNTKYFQYLLTHSELKKFNWIIQKRNQYITVVDIYFIKPMPFKNEYFEKTNAMLLKHQNQNRVKKIFLNRSVKSGRYIDNFHEIEPILKKYNFEIIDTDNKTLDFQVNLFYSTKYIISIHGAGQTNIIFSDKSLRFLEINPCNRISSHYYWLSKELNINYYDVILGDILTNVNIYPEKGFYLEPKKLENAILRMLNV